MINTHGHSLAELLVAVAVLSILISTATPAMTGMAQRNKTTYTVNQMLGAIQYARSSAVFARQNTILCPGQISCLETTDWGDSFLIFQDLNGNNRVDDNEHPLRHEQLSDGYSWHWSSFRKLPHIIYQRDGTTRAANGTLTLCKEGVPLQQIVISLSGRIREQALRPSATCN